ncbi:MAG: proline racemase family protein [Candidatus Aminicenantes bacterium]
MTFLWEPPSDWLRLTTIDAHTAGEPLRIIWEGFPPIPGETILAKRRYLQENCDHLRKALMWEPRGHADMYGCLLTEPEKEESTLGVLFLHNQGYSSMCGHGIIGLCTVAVETRRIELDGPDQKILIDSPAGRITARVNVEKGRVKAVSFQNVPSFVYSLDQTIPVPGIGDIRYDIAYGGAFYAFCRAEAFGFKLVPDEFSNLIDLGKRIKASIMDKVCIQHPFEEDLGFLYGTIFVGPAHDRAHHSRNVCVFADGEVDRSPTGTGISARAALHFARSEIKEGESFVVESILGTCFRGRVVKPTVFGGYEAVIPEIMGSAHITGRSEWLLDPADPLKHGFFLR